MKRVTVTLDAATDAACSEVWWLLWPGGTNAQDREHEARTIRTGLVLKAHATRF